MADHSDNDDERPTDESSQPHSSSSSMFTHQPMLRAAPLHLANEVILQRIDGDVWNAIHRLASVVELHHTTLLDLSAMDLFNKTKKGASAVKSATASAGRAAYNLYKTVTTEIHTAGIEDEADPDGTKYGDLKVPGSDHTLRELLAAIAASGDKIKEFTDKMSKNQAENKAVVAQVVKREDVDIDQYRTHQREFNEYTQALQEYTDKHKDELAKGKAVLAKLQGIKKKDTDKMLKERKLQKATAKATAAAEAADKERKEEEEKKEEEKREDEEKKKEEKGKEKDKDTKSKMDSKASSFKGTSKVHPSEHK